MQVFMQNRGEVSQILDHKMANMAMNGKEVKVMHLQIEWSNAEETNERFTWEPLTRINRDVPQMVTEYCNSVKLDLQDILNEESNRRGNSGFTRRKIFNKDPKGVAKTTGTGSKEGRKTPQMTPAEKRKAKRMKAFRAADEKVANSRKDDAAVQQSLHDDSVAKRLLGNFDTAPFKPPAKVHEEDPVVTEAQEEIKESE